MQNQKTDCISSVDIDELPQLSVDEQRLVEALGAGDNNIEAYSKAYGKSNYSPAALRVAACRKVAEPKIQAHLIALRSVGFTNARLTLQDRLESELAFAQRAESAGNFGAAGGAYDRLNKLMGLYIERLEVSAADPLETLRQIASVSPALAAQLAQAQGIEWQAAEPAATEH